VTASSADASQSDVPPVGTSRTSRPDPLAQGWHRWQSADVDEVHEEARDGVTELADLLGVPEGHLRDAIGEPWSPGQPGPGWDADLTIFTGRENPRTPGRPLVAIRVDPAEGSVDVGHAIGVPLPNGRHQWALGEPITELAFAIDDGADAFTAAALIDGIREGVNRIADVAMFRGTSW